MERDDRAMDVWIERIESLDSALLAPLSRESAAEGHKFVGRLADEWASAANRFDTEGEALFVARLNAPSSGMKVPAWLGIGGINRDPYTKDPNLGRVRHLYVLPEYRRMGVGRKLVQAVIDHARGRFGCLVLRTTTVAATDFYEHLGFVPTPETEHHTHALAIPDTIEGGRRRSGVPHGVSAATLMRETWMDQMIQDATARGEFSDLPGKGKPLEGLSDDPDWWIKDKLRREGVSVLPPSLRLRQEVTRAREEIAGLKTEAQVRQRVAALNEQIRAANRVSTSGPPSDIAPLDETEEVNRWKARAAGP